MRKITQFLINKFGGQLNSEINLLVSQWHSHQYSLFDMTVTLKDVSEECIVNALDAHISESGLTFVDLKSVAVIPSLANNKRDLLVKVMAMPALLENILKDVVILQYGFWREHDNVTIQDSAEHIVIKTSRKKGAVCGAFLNGTFADGDIFSFYFNDAELQELFRVAKAEKFNGVEVADEALIEQFVLKSLFYRMIDSDIGYRIEMDWPEKFQAVKGLVWSSEDTAAPVESCFPIFSSWGARIGVAFQEFDIRDVKKAGAAVTIKPKAHLAVVVNNDTAIKGPAVASDFVEEEVCQEWGKY